MDHKQFDTLYHLKLPIFIHSGDWWLHRHSFDFKPEHNLCGKGSSNCDKGTAHIYGKGSRNCDKGTVPYIW